MKNQNYYPEFRYRRGDRYCPIPPGEEQLQTIVAEPFVEAVGHYLDTEGLHFNRDGSKLYFLACREQKVCQVDMTTKEVSVVYDGRDRYPEDTVFSAVKVHKDGRLFIPYLYESHDDGGIFIVNPDGTYMGEIELAKGIVADDMVFDSKGGFYVTDMCGYPTERKGTIEYITPDFKSRTTVIHNLGCPNGITLSCDESVLWVTDTVLGVLIRTDLTEDRLHMAPMGQIYAYRTTGYLGPDSIEVDDDDNIYNALYFQGRVLVYNQYGFPIGQVLMPGREDGHNLRTTHPFIRPGTNELYICTNDDVNKSAWIFRCGAFAKANSRDFYLQ